MYPAHLSNWKPSKEHRRSRVRRYWNAACSMILGCGRDFCLETTIHGFNHIAVPGRHWIERLLWLSVTSAAIWGAIGVSLGQLQRYNENPTVITLEKDFRTWQFDLPALTACDTDRVSPSKLPLAIAARWNSKPSDPQYEYYARFVRTVANSDLFNLQGYEEFAADQSLAVDLYQLAVDVMPEVQVKATWSHGASSKWLPAVTEAGACYATNSVALADVAVIKPSINDTKQFPMTCKYSAMSCSVILEIVTNASFYVHSPFDVMDLAGFSSLVYPSLNRLTALSVMETGCGQGVKALQPQRRGCRFTDEPDHNTQVYSTNACRLSCRNKIAIKQCGCKPFYYHYEEGPECTPAGMRCLSSLSQQLKANKGEKCSCSPQCLDATFREVLTYDEIWGRGPFSTRGAVRFTVQPPRTRYTREIVFYFQDLVVSFGGAAGLFLGASFISFVEILYFLVDRLLGSCGTRWKATEVARTDVHHVVPYEANCIKELNSILENERRLNQLQFPDY